MKKNYKKLGAQLARLQGEKMIRFLNRHASRFADFKAIVEAMPKEACHGQGTSE